MRKLALAVVAATTVAVGHGHAFASSPPTLVVDDDGVQCAHAEFASIQAAVDAAQPGSIVRVCPGRYAESITVTKPLTLRGDPDAIEALDCFDPTPSQLDDADPTTQAIVEGGQSPAQQLFELAADDVVLEGFVLQGAASLPLPSDFHMFRRAVSASDRFSGYRITHNLLRLNTVGIQFGSNGVHPSRFDHNCIRENLWGLATDERDLISARVDHNLTYKTLNFAFEPALGRVADATFDHNHSRQDNTSYAIRNSTESRIIANTVESSRLGILVGGGVRNVGLEIAGNRIAVNPAFEVTTAGGGVQQGIAFAAAPPGQLPNAHATVTENAITGMRDGIVAAGPPNAASAALVDSLVSRNITNDNLRDGIVLRGLNNGITVSDNLADRNGRYGIYAQGAIGNLFQANSMFSNAVADARDENRAANHWTGNQCLTDFPVGTICGV